MSRQICLSNFVAFLIHFFLTFVDFQLGQGKCLVSKFALWGIIFSIGSKVELCRLAGFIFSIGSKVELPSLAKIIFSIGSKVELPRLAGIIFSIGSEVEPVGPTI